jgi:serine/alanine adding enzyme
MNLSHTGSIDMRVLVANEEDAGRWDAFVNSHAQCFNYHRWVWRRVIEQAFRLPTYYLFAEENGLLQGILPLVWQKSFLFGNLLCSLPFFSQAGIAAGTEKARDALLEEAIRTARELKVRYLELRHREESLSKLHVKRSKVMLVRDVYPESDQIMEGLSTKMRTNVRRSLKSGFVAEFGGRELLDSFYKVFCLRMRELGTPVYSRRFFEAIVENMPEQTYICRISHSGKLAGGAFLTGYRGLIEVNWSASDPAASSLRPNMFLFWSLLCFAGQQGYSVFDFGRSSIDSGTYNFKLQWNASPINLYWNYWTPDGREVLELNPENPRYRNAIGVWKKMPLIATQLLGPPIARCLP